MLFIGKQKKFACLLVLVLAVQIFINGRFDPFADTALIPVMLFTLTLCFIIHKLCVFFGDLFKIWYIADDILENDRKKNDIPASQLKALLFEEEAKKIEEKKESKRPKVAFDPEKWKTAINRKKNVEALRADLQTDRMIAQTYRELFQAINRRLPLTTVNEVRL